MEKFAVDIEKVLDEFEINEEREELLTPQNVNKPQSFCQPRLAQSARPPAASYRRPSFEPINLADADFAASPQTAIIHNYNEEYFNNSMFCQKEDAYNSNGKYSKLLSKPHQLDPQLYSKTIPEQTPSFSEILAKQPVDNGRSRNINTNQPNSISRDDNASFSHTHQNSITNQKEPILPLDYEAPPPYSLLPPPEPNYQNQNTKNHENVKEEKPDLIDTKVCSETGEKEEILDKGITQLPDIAASGQSCNRSTSVSTVSSRNVTLDLINSSSVINSALNAESPQTSSNAPIGFNTLHNVSDSELEQYLHELDELEDDTTDDCSLILHDSVTNNLEALKANIKKVDNMDSNLKKNVEEEEDLPSEVDSSRLDHTDNSQNVNICYDIQCDSLNDATFLSPDLSVADSLASNCEDLSDSNQLVKEDDNSFDRTVSEVNTKSSEESDITVPIAKLDSNLESSNNEVVNNQTEIREEMPLVAESSRVEEITDSSEILDNELIGRESPCESQISDIKESNEISIKSETLSNDEDVCECENEMESSCNSVNVLNSEEVKMRENSNVTKSEFIVSETQIENCSSESNTNGAEVLVDHTVKVIDEAPASNLEVTTDMNCNLSNSVEGGGQNLVQEVPNFEPTETSPQSEMTDSSCIENPDLETSENGACALDSTTEPKPVRPNSLQLVSQVNVSNETSELLDSSTEVSSPNASESKLGKSSPYWIPDSEALNCMRCETRFTLIRRRHHCRACGFLLCSKCCNMKTKLEYLEFAEARVCQYCYVILEKNATPELERGAASNKSPNPNNPMEYCSTIPPLQQAANSLHQPVPSVLVPVGVLKREGRSKPEVPKQVIFSDGIRPGGDLTELDGSSEPRLSIKRQVRQVKMKGDQRNDRLSNSCRRSDEVGSSSSHRGMNFGWAGGNQRRNNSFVDINSLPEKTLPRIISRVNGETQYSDLEKPITLDDPPLKFAINPNLFVIVKRVNLDCCANMEVWCMTTEGLSNVCQDEIVFVLECLPDETKPPRDIFLYVDILYKQAPKGTTVSELSFSPAEISNFLGSKDHGGFLYIRTSFQCVNKLIIPPAPYLIGLLIHRWEAPWAKLFPIRLMLRYGAEYRYYPCFLVSIRFRQSLYGEIGSTIIRILADFRKFEYTLSSVRGLKIHMEDQQTTILLPRNRYDQVVKAINNSNDSVLAFSGNFSLEADSHFVCMQNSENESYFTQAIYINSRPRKITGASFIVFNGALKTCGLSGKSVLVEDGFVVYIPSESMEALRSALKDMKDYSIGCGKNSEVIVLLKWSEDDMYFNVGVKSVIDGKPLDGIPSIRVHNGADFLGNTRFIRWTEVFIFHSEEDSAQGGDSLDVSRLSESLAQATCSALVPLLDLLAQASLFTLAVRVSIHPDNVGYEAGSCYEKLAPIYMKQLDDGLIPVLHQAAINMQDSPTTLELVFKVMEQV